MEKQLGYRAMKYNAQSVYLVFGVLSGLGSGVFGQDNKEDDGSDDAISRGITIGAVIGVCGLISLTTWIGCMIYNKCRKDRVGHMTFQSPPEWSASLAPNTELAGPGFSSVSDGLKVLGHGHVVRTRQGSYKTDGAKWAVPMTSGKHVFEITWTWSLRGKLYAGVGVGTETAPVEGPKAQTLVGTNDKSWGLDIIKRRVVHNNKMVKSCPTGRDYIPDKFVMYVDLDEGYLGFGNGVAYWGDVITTLPKQPLYVMVATCHPRAEILVTYMGTAVPGSATTNTQNQLAHLYPPTYSEVEQGEGSSSTRGVTVTKPVPVMNSDGKPNAPPPSYSESVNNNNNNKK